MTWLVLALVTACCETGRDLLGKRGTADVEPIVLAFLLNATGAVALWPFAIWADSAIACWRRD